MKKIKTIIILVSVAGWFTSCNDDYLDVVPRDQLSDATFWQNEEQLNLATVGVYDNWGWAEDDGVHNVPTRAVYLGESWSDNSTSSSWWNGFWYNLWSGNISPEQVQIDSYWSAIYETVRKANVVLANIERPVMDEVARKRYQGEMLFIRAYEYHTLLYNWGGVPIVDRPLAIDEIDIPRATAEATLDFIITDLDIAIANLPIVGLQSGRITKGAALGLKARTLLYSGQWTAAAASAKAAMDIGIYDLYQTSAGDGYQTQFSAEDNEEVLFSWKYNQNEQGHANEFPGLTFGGDSALFGPTKALVNAYDGYNSLTDAIVAVDPANLFANRDPRLAYTIYLSGTETGYATNKFEGMDGNSENKLMRFAEVLLTYAEAKIEANSIDQSVLDAINKVRARAYGASLNELNKYPEVTTTDQSQLRDIVRNERRVELAMEGLRWYDITRWRIAGAVMNGPVGTKVRTWSDKDYLRPIPQAQIDLSDGVLKQNPGY